MFLDKFRNGEIDPQSGLGCVKFFGGGGGSSASTTTTKTDQSTNITTNTDTALENFQIGVTGQDAVDYINAIGSTVRPFLEREFEILKDVTAGTIEANKISGNLISKISEPFLPEDAKKKSEVDRLPLYLAAGGVAYAAYELFFKK